MRHIILFNHFHFFQKGLVDLQRGHIISKNVILNRTLNLGFQNFKLLVKECTFYRLHFFSFFIVLYVYLSWYFHFQHVLLLGFNNVKIQAWQYARSPLLKTLSQNSKRCLQTSKKYLSCWFGPLLFKSE